MVYEALKSIDLSEVEIIPQTMPPFPWHFGGQRFHNLFMDADEIVSFCQKFDKIKAKGINAPINTFIPDF